MICPDCKEKVYGTVCTNCGLVIEDRPLAIELEIKDSETLSRTYSTSSSPDIGFSTTHSKETTNKELARAFKKEKNITKNDEWRYYEAYVEIKRICDYLQLGDKIFYEAMDIRRRFIMVAKTQMKYAILNACVIIGCRMYKFPIFFKDIYEISTEDPKKIKKAYKRIINELNLRIPHLTLQDHILHYANVFDLTPTQRTKALEFAAIISKKVNMSGKKLSGYAGAIIKHITKKRNAELLKKLNITEPTICARIGEIEGVIA